MKIVLLKDVPGVGRKHELKEVHDGYGRNFLIAKGFAALATDKLLTQLGNEQRQKANHDQKLQEKYRHVGAELEKRTFTVEVKTSPTGQIFGSVSEKDVLAKIKDKMNLDLDKKQLSLPKIKQLGEYVFEIKLASDIIVHPKVKVITKEDAKKEK